MRWPTCTFCSIHILLSISWKKVISGWFSNLRHFGQLQFIDFLTKITLRDILLLKKSCWIRKSYFAVLNRIIDEDRWKSGHFPKKANPWFSVKNGFPMSTKNYKYRALDGINLQQHPTLDLFQMEKIPQISTFLGFPSLEFLRIVVSVIKMIWSPGWGLQINMQTAIRLRYFNIVRHFANIY